MKSWRSSGARSAPTFCRRPSCSSSTGWAPTRTSPRAPLSAANRARPRTMERSPLLIARGMMVTALVASSVPGSALAAASYPERTIRLVVPFPPGGGNDVLGRIVGEQLGGMLGQRVLVDNKGGAGGMVGTTEVIKSAPSGYTL